MGFFDLFIRSKPVKEPEKRFTGEYADFLTAKGKSIPINTTDSALRSTVVYACVNAISSDIATMAWGVFEKKGKQRTRLHNSLDRIVSKEPHFLYSSVNFYRALIANYLLKGDGYAIIQRNSRGSVTGLVVVNPNCVEVVHTAKDGKEILKYIVKGTKEGIYDDTYDYSDIIHISDLTLDGLKGISRIALAKRNIEYNIRGIEYGNDYMKGSIKLGGYIKHPGRLTEEQVKDYRKSFKQTYADEVGGIAILSNDAEFTPFNYSMTMADSQFIESLKFSTEEIARMFRVPLHKIGMLDRSTNNNIEKQSIEYVMDCLRPIIVLLESEMDRKLFVGKKNLYVKCNMNALLRGDMESRGKYYESMVNIRAMSPNDVLALEDMNPKEDGDMIGWSLNDVPLSQVKEYYESKINSNAN